MADSPVETPRRRPKPGEKLRLRVFGLAFGGAGVAHSESGLVVFVHGGVPGDDVTAYVTKRRRGYIEARVETVESPSVDRTAPECSHFGGPAGNLCGGCKWQNYNYEKQLLWKEQQVRDHLERIAGIPEPRVEPVIGMENPWGYRNKMEYTFSASADGRLALGLHRAGSFDRIVDVDRCLLQTERCDELRNSARELCRARGLTPHSIRAHEGLMRNFVIRSAGADLMGCVVTHGDGFAPHAAAFADALTAGFPDMKSLMWFAHEAMNGVAIAGAARLLAGDTHITDTVLGLRMKVSPASFMQTNPAQCARLYEKLLDCAAMEGGETVFDLYTGTAPIAMLLARRARRVVGIESNTTALEDARVNLTVNAVGNVELVGGEVENRLGALCASGAPDIVAVDPPRVGLHKNALSALIAARPRRVLYVSCNPATLARDTAALVDAGYSLTLTQPFDMFPHTAHIECLSRFDL